MTEEQIKEYISRHFIGLVASRGGFKTTSVLPDSGTDLTVSRAVFQNRPQGRRLFDDPNVLHLQLKCTCAANIYPDVDAFKYDLDVKAYNDLVSTWGSGSYVKLLLILLVLPDDPTDWVSINPTELIVRRAAYWYHPAPTDTMSSNAATVRIRIPLANSVSLNLFEDKFTEYYSA